VWLFEDLEADDTPQLRQHILRDLQLLVIRQLISSGKSEAHQHRQL
jgi:hypothetical protein